MIDPAKKYRTRDGREVRIYAVEMSDIVKRLRNNEKLLPHMAAMLREEPLTSGLAGMVDAYVAESKEAAAEIERLRAALKNIRELNFTSDGWAHSDLIEQEIVFALAQPAAPGGDA